MKKLFLLFLLPAIIKCHSDNKQIQQGSSIMTDTLESTLITHDDTSGRWYQDTTIGHCDTTMEYIVEDSIGRVCYFNYNNDNKLTVVDTARALNTLMKELILSNKRERQLLKEKDSLIQLNDYIVNGTLKVLFDKKIISHCK